MDSFINRKVTVGQKLVKSKGENLGYGLYTQNEHIYVSVMGTLKHHHPNMYTV